MVDAAHPSSDDVTVDRAALREAVGHYPTGVVVVTGVADDGTPLGMVVGSFSAVSVDPPLVLFMPTRHSATYAALRESSTLCMNVLAHDQREACRVLSSRDADKFDRVTWTWSEHGLPQIADAVAYIHCRPVSHTEAGDHLIVLCEVSVARVARPVVPMLYFQGGYGGFSLSGMTAQVDASLIAAVKVAEFARPQLERLAERFGSTVEALVQVNDHDQTVGASAYGAESRMDERLGVRIPLIPPLGDVAVAFDADASALWLARARSGDLLDLGVLETHLAAVRESGYSAVCIDDGDEEGYAAVVRAIREYASGDLTPARSRVVRTAIVAGSRYFRGSIPLDEQPTNLASLSVPVYDPDATERRNSGLTIRMRGRHPQVTGEEISRWVAELTSAAWEVAAALAGPGREDYRRYTAAGLRSNPSLTDGPAIAGRPFPPNSQIGQLTRR